MPDESQKNFVISSRRHDKSHMTELMSADPVFPQLMPVAKVRDDTGRNHNSGQARACVPFRSEYIQAAVGQPTGLTPLARHAMSQDQCCAW
jgi:hypothetical protein